jgi:flavin reductase (DIM6/NTAB) family NADH-FMN oxidoreductase RutF
VPGPIALISTVDKSGRPNVAPKSWLQMVSFEPPILMFAGSKGNTTENNITETKCFAVNFVDSSMAEAVFGCLPWHGRQRIEKCGFELVPASEIDAPLVDNCRAHLECRLIDTKEIGSGLIIFGEIVAASIWDEIIKADPARRYEMLDQIVFLEDGVWGRIKRGE